MVGNLPQRIHIADLEAPFNVFLQNGSDKALDVAAFVPQALEFGQAACDDVVHKRARARGIGLGGDAGSVNLMICAVLGEGERIEADFVVASGQMGSQFAAEQFGIAARYEDSHLAPQEPVDEQMPAIHILNLVKKQIRDIGTIELVYAGKDGVQIFRFHTQQAVIVKVDITVADAMLQQDLVADGRFTAAPDANDDLGHRAVELEQGFLPAGHPLRRVVSQYFISLFCKDLQDYSFLNHIIP